MEELAFERTLWFDANTSAPSTRRKPTRAHYRAVANGKVPRDSHARWRRGPSMRNRGKLRVQA